MQVVKALSMTNEPCTHYTDVENGFTLTKRSHFDTDFGLKPPSSCNSAPAAGEWNSRECARQWCKRHGIIVLLATNAREPPAASIAVILFKRLDSSVTICL